ncbi:MAG: argininosuccinate lyase [Phycisphaerales bacterium]|nr:argininosuccinate lyase [Phycisphaerales bacterium]
MSKKPTKADLPPARSRQVPPSASPSSKPWEHAKHAEGSSSDPLAARFVESLSYDTRLYSADIRGSLAHARMLARTGLISREDYAAIDRGLAQITREIESAPAGPNAVGVNGAWPGWKIELEDVHMCIEAALVEKVGDAGRKLHTGRSRNDQVALDLRLWLRDASAELTRGLQELLGAFVHLAGQQGDVLLPSYTHLQRAQPIVVGAECMAWWAMFDRDRRLLDAMLGFPDGLSASPLGSGAVAGSTLPLDRAMAAGDLGFAGPTLSSIDSTASRDEALDYLHACSRIALHLSRLAEQWIIYCTTEFGFLTLGEAYTTGSSMMPQKRNPDMLELIRGRCATILGHHAALQTLIKGLPLAYNRDLQEDKRHVFAAHDMTRDCIAMAARIVATARFNPERINASLDRGHLDATVLAEYLVAKGVPFRTAHQVVGQLVRVCDRTKRHALSLLDVDEIRDACRALGHSVSIGEDVFSHLSSANVVSAYRSSGHGGSSGGGYKDWLHTLRAPRADAAGVWIPLKSAEADAKPGPTLQAAVDQARPISQSSLKVPLAPASTATTADTPPLFDVSEDDSTSIKSGAFDALVTLYEQTGRTLDDLPYTEDFDTLAAKAKTTYPSLNTYALFRKLHTLRKAGKLPRIGRPSTLPVKLEPGEEQWLRDRVVQVVGTLGQRDRLPYHPDFDAIVESFNSHTGRTLAPHAVWRLVAKLAK